MLATSETSPVVDDLTQLTGALDLTQLENDEDILDLVGAGSCNGMCTMTCVLGCAGGCTLVCSTPCDLTEGLATAAAMFIRVSAGGTATVGANNGVSATMTWAFS